MAVVLLKNISDKINILEQQNYILSYAKKNQISIDVIELETSDSSKKLEQRNEFKGFLRSLKHNDTLIVYDFWVLSNDVGELVKVCDCLLRRNISLHVSIKKEIIEPSSSPLHVLNLLSKQRHLATSQKQNATQGRPKGRMSQSKFDIHRSQIISYLEQGYSVSKIALTLGISRTSLKDYINSRNLKNLVLAKKELLGVTPKEILQKSKKFKKCDLIAKKQGAEDGKK